MASRKPLVQAAGEIQQVQTGDDLGAVTFTTVTASAVAGGVVATQTDQEAATATDKVVTPAVQHYHPGTCKAWVIFSVAAGVVTIRSQYKVSSITRNATGNFMVNVTGAFSAQANVCPVACAGLSGSRIWTDLASYSGISTTAVQVITANSAGTLTDPDVCCVHIFGDF